MSMGRSIGSAAITFGLVVLPVKVYTACSSEKVSFNMISPKGGRVKQKLWCEIENRELNRAEVSKGYEYAKGQYVIFTEEELKLLETERSNTIEIIEFVPLNTVDLIQIEKTYYLGPNKGGDKAYKLLSETLDQAGKVAVARWSARGKEQLVLVRSYKNGLILHQMFYANEVRAFDGAGANLAIGDAERNLAFKLVNQLSSKKFEPEKYHDTYVERVNEAVNQKVSGQDIKVLPAANVPSTFDLMDALKKSLEGAQIIPETPTKKEIPKTATKKTVVKKKKAG